MRPFLDIVDSEFVLVKQFCLLVDNSVADIDLCVTQLVWSGGELSNTSIGVKV
jgi:hypothetical protein